MSILRHPAMDLPKVRRPRSKGAGPSEGDVLPFGIEEPHKLMIVHVRPAEEFVHLTIARSVGRPVKTDSTEIVELDGGGWLAVSWTTTPHEPLAWLRLAEL